MTEDTDTSEPYTPRNLTPEEEEAEAAHYRAVAQDILDHLEDQKAKASPAFPANLSALIHTLNDSLTNGQTETELLQKQFYTLNWIFDFMLGGLGDSKLEMTSDNGQNLMKLILKVQRQCAGTARALTAMRYMDNFLHTTQPPPLKIDKQTNGLSDG